MTPEEAAKHEWLQPSGSSSYNHSKAMNREAQQQSQEVDTSVSDNQPTAVVAQTFQQPKYQRTLPQTPNNTTLPEIKTPSMKGALKTQRERFKGRELLRCVLLNPPNAGDSSAGLTSSTTDLDSVASAAQAHGQAHGPAYSLHRLYNARKSTTNATQSSAKYSGMSHSQSTGDVTAMFGRA